MSESVANLSTRRGNALHIVFGSANPPAGVDYFRYPEHTVAQPESNLALPEASEELDLEVLRESVRKELTGTKVSKIVSAKANDLFYWFYWPLFKNLHCIRRLVLTHRFEKIVIHGSTLPQYSAYSNKGDEARPIAYRADLLYPKFLVEACSELCPIEIVGVLPNVWIRLAYRLRSEALLAIKLSLLLLKYLRSFFLPKQKAPKEAKHYWIARGLVGIEYFDRILSRLSDYPDLNFAIVYDTPLRGVLGKIAPQIQRRSDVYLADHRFKAAYLLGVLREARSNLVSGKVTLSDGKLSITDDLGRLSKELAYTSVDVFLHAKLLDAALDGSTPRTIFSTELVSPYIFYQADIARAHRAKFYTVQAFAFTPEDVVSCIVGDGLVVQSKAIQEPMARMFPALKHKIFYVGDLEFTDQPSSEPAQPGEIRHVVFFSQPYEQNIQRKIVESILSNTPTQSRIVVKVHPRDSAQHYEGLDRVQVIGSGEADNIELIRKSDLVVSRSSSVLQEALFLAVPYLACTFNRYELDFKPVYLDESLGVRVLSVEALEETLRQFPQYRERFLEARRRVAMRHFSPFQAAAFARLCE